MSEKAEAHDTKQSDLTDLLCCCDDCNDGEGDSIYPYYGVAPHECYWRKPGGFSNPLGTSTLEPRETWPDNFSEDPEAPGCGVYTHCLSCGRPDNKELWYQDQETRRKRKTEAA